MKFCKLWCPFYLLLRGSILSKKFYFLGKRHESSNRHNLLTTQFTIDHSSPQLKKLKWSWDKQCFCYFMSETLILWWIFNYVFWNSFLLECFFFRKFLNFILLYFFGESSWILFKYVVYIQIFKGNVSYTYLITYTVLFELKYCVYFKCNKTVYNIHCPFYSSNPNK